MENRYSKPDAHQAEIVAGALGFFFGIAVGIILVGAAQFSPPLWLSATRIAQSLGIGIAGGIMAFLVMEQISRRRAEAEEAAPRFSREQLIARMRRHDPAEAAQAVQSLREAGWLHDGTLRRINLTGAQLAGANLIYADLEGANFTAANLQRASLSDATLRSANLGLTQLEQASLVGADLRGAALRMAYLQGADLRRAQVTDQVLAEAFALRGATLPDGSLYDGRFNLAGDLERAAAEGIDTEDAAAMQRWYESASAAEAG